MTKASIKYLENSVNTATKGELTLILFNGCMKFVNISKRAIEENNLSIKNENLMKAQNIIKELMITLDKDFQYSHNILSIYDFIYRRLVDGNIKNDVASIIEAEELIRELKNMWVDIIEANRKLQVTPGDKI